MKETVVDLKMNVNTGDSEKKIDKVTESVKDSSKEVEALKEQSNNLNTALDNATGGAVSGFMKMKTAIKSAVTSTKALKIALVATGIGAFVVAIGSLVANLRNSEEGFNRVQKVLDKFGVIAGNVTDILYSLGTSLFGLVTGDFELMSKSFDQATDRLANFGNETQREIKLAGDLADQRAKLAKDERALVVERAEADRERAELLEKAIDKENFTTEQRIKFLEKAGKLEEEITNKEVEAAKLKLQIQQQQNTLSESSAEDLEAEANLEAEVIRLEQARLTKQKEVTGQIIAFRAEAKAARKAEQDGIIAANNAEQAIKDAADKKLLDDENKRQESILAIENKFKTIKEDLEAVSQIEKLELEKSRVLLELEQLDANEQQKANIILHYQDLINDEEEKNREQKRIQDEILKKQQLAEAADTFGKLSALFAQGSDESKAAATAQALINTYLGVTEALKQESTLPSPLDVIAKVANVATVLGTGLQAVKQIQSVQPGGSSAPSISGASANTANSSTPPAFNVVGASDTSQLAESISNQQQKPIKTFVVASDVSTATSLERNKVESATI